jgi:hypothetical protein
MRLDDLTHMESLIYLIFVSDVIENKELGTPGEGI